MTGQEPTGFGGSKIQKTLLLQAEKEYGICYTIAGACSDEKRKKKWPANLVLLLLERGCAPASTCCLPAFAVTQQKCALELAPAKKHLPL